MKYWHPFALRRPMREIAARYPITYRKVGETVAACGLACDVEPPLEVSYQIMIVILAAMPPHIIPYGSMGDDTPWSHTDWSSLLADLKQNPA